jgi:hypothetical protein
MFFSTVLKFAEKLDREVRNLYMTAANKFLWFVQVPIARFNEWMCSGYAHTVDRFYEAFDSLK